MRLALACLRSEKGDVESNLARHLDVLDAHSGCDLVLFPEMSLTGYAPACRLALDAPAVRAIVGATGDGRPAGAFGLVEPAGTVAHVVAAGGEVVLVQRKAFLGEDEEDVFVAGPPVRSTAEVGGRRVAVAICAEVHRAAPFAVPADVVLCAAAPGLYGRRVTEADWRKGYDWWRGAAGRDLATRGVWCAVATAAGSTVDEDFPGWGALVSPAGEVVAETADWAEQVLEVVIPD